MTANEFTRLVRLDVIGQAPHDMRFTADPAEREALARRFALESLDDLEVAAAVRRDAAAVLAEGTVKAHVVQNCVATGRPIQAVVDAPFNLRFVPEGEDNAGEEIELSDADCDTLTYTGAAIDLGEAAAETLLLALDPFPRCPDADDVLREAGVVGEEEAGPFAALKALKDKLGG